MKLGDAFEKAKQIGQTEIPFLKSRLSKVAALSGIFLSSIVLYAYTDGAGLDRENRRELQMLREHFAEKILQEAKRLEGMVQPYVFDVEEGWGKLPTAWATQEIGKVPIDTYRLESGHGANGALFPPQPFVLSAYESDAVMHDGNIAIHNLRGQAVFGQQAFDKHRFFLLRAPGFAPNEESFRINDLPVSVTLRHNEFNDIEVTLPEQAPRKGMLHYTLEPILETWKQEGVLPGFEHTEKEIYHWSPETQARLDEVASMPQREQVDTLTSYIRQKGRYLREHIKVDELNRTPEMADKNMQLNCYYANQLLTYLLKSIGIRSVLRPGYLDDGDGLATADEGHAKVLALIKDGGVNLAYYPDATPHVWADKKDYSFWLTEERKWKRETMPASGKQYLEALHAVIGRYVVQLRLHYNEEANEEIQKILLESIRQIDERATAATTHEIFASMALRDAYQELTHRAPPPLSEDFAQRALAVQKKRETVRSKYMEKRKSDPSSPKLRRTGAKEEETSTLSPRRNAVERLLGNSTLP